VERVWWEMAVEDLGESKVAEESQEEGYVILSFRVTNSGVDRIPVVSGIG
jgi:hypothetical protein